MPNLLVAQHRPGFYLRVITEGGSGPGTTSCDRRGHHELSVVDVDALLYLPDRNIEQLRKIVDVPALSPGWQQSFTEMLAADQTSAAAALRQSEWSRGGTDSGITGHRGVVRAENVLSIRLAADDGFAAVGATRPILHGASARRG